MTSDEKIKWVREKVYEQAKLNSFGIATYSLLPVVQEFSGEMDDMLSSFFGTPPTKQTEKKSITVLPVDEQIDILKRLEKDKLLKIVDIDANKAMLEVFPPHPCPIKLKTLEHISQELARVFTGSQILDTLLDYGIPRCDIPYPNTKWRTIQELLLALATSPNEEQRAKFGGAITCFLHPLNFNANDEESQKLIVDFNKYLKYDGYEIVLNDDGDGYKLIATGEKTKIKLPPVLEKKKEERISFTSIEPITEELKAAVSEVLAEIKSGTTKEEKYSEQVEEETSRLRQPEVAERLAVVREAYKTLMAITSSFCIDPTTPSRELNTAYAELSQLVSKALGGFCDDTGDFEVFSFDEYSENNFGIPFGNLYRAELEFKGKNKKMHWDEIRPEMNAVLGRIEEVCDAANAPEILSEPKIQTTINGARLLLSQIAAERKEAAPKDTVQKMQMEITSIPELQVRNAEDSTITKGKKRIQLPKFKATDWAKITIRFIDERNVLITADKKEQVSSDYEALGFANDTQDKPNKAWAFLLGLAQNNGATEELPTPIPDKIKQLKKQLSDRLKVIFKNDTEPFFDPSDDHIYTIKINLVPPTAKDADTDTLGTREYLEETMTLMSDE